MFTYICTLLIDIEASARESIYFFFEGKRHSAFDGRFAFGFVYIHALAPFSACSYRRFDSAFIYIRSEEDNISTILSFISAGFFLWEISEYLQLIFCIYA